MELGPIIERATGTGGTSGMCASAIGSDLKGDSEKDDRVMRTNERAETATVAE